MFESAFRNQLLDFTTNTAIIENLWSEIERDYGHPKRYYHTLEHLNSLTAELIPLKDMIDDWPTILFSIAYHDIVYNPLRQDNEQKSADVALHRLTLLNIPDAQKNRCKEQILATKSHELSDHADTNYFTDADLAILGADPNTYQEYAKAIRKEYQLYPDLIYNPGRKKVLEHFLEMPAIYKTDFFSEKYELRARENLTNELEMLMRPDSYRDC